MQRLRFHFSVVSQLECCFIAIWKLNLAGTDKIWLHQFCFKEQQHILTHKSSRKLENVFNGNC